MGLDQKSSTNSQQLIQEKFGARLEDPSGVDIDIHLLQNPTESGGVVSGCLGGLMNI